MPRGARLRIVLGAAASAGLLLGAIVLAAHNQGLFELDGNVQDDSGAGIPSDWAGLFDAGGNATAQPPPFLASVFLADAANPDLTFHPDEEDEDTENINQWQCQRKSNPTNQTNMLNGYAAAYVAPTGNVSLFAGFERGNATAARNVGFWFLQNPVACTSPAAGSAVFTGNHTLGDVFVRATISNTGAFSSLQAYRWNTSASDNLQLMVTGGNCTLAAPNDNLCGRVNNATLATPWPPGSSVPIARNSFLEVGLNLNAVSTDVCFTHFIAEHRSSADLDAELQDYGLGPFQLCDARISISPQEDTNPVNTEHTLTVLAERKNATGAFGPAQGVLVNTNLAGAGSYVGAATCITGAAGTCTVNITSPSVGTSTVTARANITVGNTILFRQTNGTAGSSGPATKHWALRETTTTTTPSNATVQVGETVFDKAVVASMDTLPSGEVAFFVCAVDVVPCAEGGTPLGTNLVLFGMATSDPFVPLLPGTYCFRGNYTGTAVHAPSSDASLSECFVATKAESTTITAPSHDFAAVGEPVNDTAVVIGNQGAGTPTGNVSFYLCPALPCVAGGDFVGNATLDAAGVAVSPDVTPADIGKWCFRGEYGGDARYLPSSDASPDECFTVTKAASTTTTTPSAASVALGELLTDNATVAGNAVGGPPTGLVAFYACIGLCTDAGDFVGDAILDAAGNATSPPFMPSAPGTWCFRGEYLGDARYEPSEDASAGECFEVRKAASTTTTTPAPATIALGQNVTDAALVEGNVVGGVPTGRVDFFVCPEGVAPCAAGGSLVSSEALVGGTAVSLPYEPTAPGTYCWRGEYLGSEVYEPSTDASLGECFTVTKAPSMTVTQPSDLAPEVGSMVNDTAMVTGNPVGGTPTGNVSFFLCAAEVVPCVAGGSLVGTVDLDAAGVATSPSVTVPSAGTFCWRGEYNGDASYEPSEDASVGECFSVGKAFTEMTTTPSDINILLGDNVTDSALVEGDAGPPTGNVSFFVCAAGVVPCVAGGVLLGTVDLDGSGMATSPPFTPTAAGAYCFRGEYNGDATYAPSFDASQRECFTVERGLSTTTTTPSNATIPVGGAVVDHATVAGNAAGGTPTGQVAFYVCNLGVAPCAAGGTFLGNGLLVDGNASSPPFVPTLAGTYCFRGEYEGDANYQPSEDASLGECFEATFCAPTGLTVEAKGNPARNVLSWDSTASALAYLVYRAVGAGNETFDLHGTTTNTTLTDSDVAPGTLYRYRVTALILLVGETDPCGTVEATAIPEFPALATQALALLGAVAVLVAARRP